MFVYEKYSATNVAYLESHSLEIFIVGAIIGAIVVIGMLYNIKHIIPDVEREHSRELPEGWFGNLAKLIMKNAQKIEIDKKSYEYYVWKHNGYEAMLYLSWQDFYDGLDAFDLPILMSAEIEIYKPTVYKKEIFYAFVDKNDYIVSKKNYLYNYNIRKNMPITIRIKGKDVEVP